VGIVGTLHERVVFTRRVDVLAHHLAGVLPEDATVLDVGAGDGTIAARILELRPDLCISGIDVLVRPTTKIDVRPFDGVHIPFGDSSFDAVMFVDVLHHTDDPLRLLREAGRVARKAVVIKDHLADGFGARSTLRAMDWVGNARHGVALPYNYLTRAEWSPLFEAAGLEVAVVHEHLGLYPRPASWLFDRDLHAIWRLDPLAPS
jgi:SAM-dependent methyltransferase